MFAEDNYDGKGGCLCLGCLLCFFVNVTHHFQLDAYVVCAFYVMWHFVRHAMM